MVPVIFRCPNTGHRVQALFADDATEDRDTYESVTCMACRQLHLVNRKTGKTLGADEE
jgi:hypothetical protein